MFRLFLEGALDTVGENAEEHAALTLGEPPRHARPWGAGRSQVASRHEARLSRGGEPRTRLKCFRSYQTLYARLDDLRTLDQ